MFAGASAWGQQVSNSGNEFWAVFPTHESDLDANQNILHANISIFITSDQASSGKISCGDLTVAFAVAANAVTEVKIPRDKAYIDATDADRSLPGRAIHITTDPGRAKIVVYAHIFAGRRSAAALIIPKEALGNKYYSFNYEQYNNEGKNYIVIVATEPNTKVRLSQNNADLVPGGITLANINDVYEYTSAHDLTGTLVTADGATACNRFAMFSGSTGVKIAGDNCVPSSLDPLFQQSIPVESWGKLYGIIPFSNNSPSSQIPVRTSGQYIRVIAQDDNTDLMIDNKWVTTLNSGGVYRTPTPLIKPAMISSTKPIAVAQYALSQNCADSQSSKNPQDKKFSDPDMVILNPVEYAIKNITLYSSDKEDIKEQYINIIIKTSGASSLRINGSAPSTTLKPMEGSPGFSFLQLNLNSYHTKSFNIAASEGFNAVAYGFGDVESYAYSAGTALSGTSYVSGIRTASGQQIDSACIYDDFFFRLSLPYPAASINWQMDKTESPTLQQYPAYRTIVANGRTIYQYDLPKTPAYTKPGNHAIHIIAHPQNGSFCNDNDLQIDHTFLVNDVPPVLIKAIPAPCPGTYSFEADIAIPESGILARHWDLDDTGNPLTDASTAVRPEHTYINKGERIITLTVSFRNGCDRTVSSRINIDPNILAPKVIFDKLSDVCVTTAPFKVNTAKELNGTPGSGSYSGPGINSNGDFDPAKAGPGSHTLYYTYVIGSCKVIKDQTINVLGSPEVTGYTARVIQGNALTLKPIYKAAESATYRWDNSNTLNLTNVAYPIAIPASTTTYTVSVSNGICTATATIKVVVLPSIKVPNTITPNGDGINDQWNISNTNNYPSLTVDIFTRYGVPVYHSKEYSKPWDGRYNGQYLPAGVYYYKIDTGIPEYTLSGHITILK